MTFETLPYEMSHGRSPRGRGSWAFAPFHLRNDSAAAVFSPSMTFTEAKRWARQQQQLTAFQVIAVLP
jgi:hypothetical protein